MNDYPSLEAVVQSHWPQYVSKIRPLFSMLQAGDVLQMTFRCVMQAANNKAKLFILCSPRAMIAVLACVPELHMIKHWKCGAEWRISCSYGGITWLCKLDSSLQSTRTRWAIERQLDAMREKRPTITGHSHVICDENQYRAIPVRMVA